MLPANANFRTKKFNYCPVTIVVLVIMCVAYYNIASIRVHKVKEFGFFNVEVDDEDPLRLFFIESSLDSNMSFISINPRQACSIESAAIAHPHILIYVIVLTRNYSGVGKLTNVLNSQNH